MWLRAEHDLNMLLACRRVWFIVPARWERSKKDDDDGELMQPWVATGERNLLQRLEATQ